MSFLNASALWLLPLAAAPLALHLLSLRRARRLPFSDLTLLRQAYARSLPATRLRQWIILLARCLALAALILALARPILRGAVAGGGVDGGMDLVVLLDTSWSMGARERGRPRFERARDAAVALVRLAGPADRVAAGGVSQGLDAPLSFSRLPSEAAAALGRLSPGTAGTDLGAAVAAACRFLAGGDSKRRRVVAVISDNAANGLAGFGRGGAAPAPCPPELALVGLAWESPPPNAAVFDAAPAAAAQKNEAPALTARLALFGEPRRQTALDMVVQERRVSRRAVGLSGGSPASFELALPSSREPELWGRVELPSDALAPDDSWNFSLRSEPRPRVLLAAGSPRSQEAGGGIFAFRTLLSDGGRLPFRVDVSDLGRLGQVHLGDYAAVVIDDPRSLAPASAEALMHFVREGGGLWLLAGAGAPAALKALESILPAALGPAEAGPSAPGLRVDAAPTEGHERFAWSEFELAVVGVSRRLSCVPRPGAAVWFRDASGAPLLVAGEVGRGRVLAWASSLEVGWTNLALKPLFTAWADSGLRWLSRYEGEPQWRALKVGEHLIRTWAPGERVPSRVALRGPGGRRTVLLVRERRIEYEDTREPGLYFLEWEGTGGKASLEAWAVNLDRSLGESDLAAPSIIPWKTLRPEHIREDFETAVHGREARTGLLGAVAALLLLELALSAPRREKVTA